MKNFPICRYMCMECGCEFAYAVACPVECSKESCESFYIEWINWEEIVNWCRVNGYYQ